MTEKLLIHLNKSLSNIETNKNNEIIYNLKNPIEVETGDTVSLYKSFINERGLSDATLCLQSDMDISMRYLFYIEGGPEFKQYYVQEGVNSSNTKVNTSQWLFEYRTLHPNYLQAHEDNPGQTLDDPSDIIDGQYTALDMGGYYIMFRMYYDTTANKIKLMPSVNTYSFTIPQDNYSPSSLAQYITDRMNGVSTQSNISLWLNNAITSNETFFNENFKHPLVEQINLEYISSNNFPPFFTTTDPSNVSVMHTIKFYDTVLNDMQTTGPETWDGYPLFINMEKSKEMLNDLSNGSTLYWEDYSESWSGTINGVSITSNGLISGGGAFYPCPIGVRATNYDPTATIDPGDFISYENQRIIGCKEFNIIYEAGEKNRFSMSGFHSPLKLSSHTQNGIPDPGSEGQIIVKTDFPNENVGNYNYKGIIPKHSSGGIMILSLIDDLLVKYIPGFSTILNAFNIEKADYGNLDIDVLGTIANMTSQDLIRLDNTNKINFEKKYIEESIWYRLGFKYDSIVNINNNLLSFLEYQTGNTVINKGVITFNEINLSSQEGVSGLGASAVAQNLPIQFFDASGLMSTNLLLSHNPFDVNQPIEAGVNSTFSSVFLTTNMNYITAENLPDLMSKNNYYIVESDIVRNNYLDVIGNSRSVVGIISLENTNQDTLYGTEGLEFTYNNNQLIKSINVRLTNPDGTDIPNSIINKNSSFIFIIEKPLSVFKLNKK